MSLADFMQKLQEQDDSDVIYSEAPEQTIKVIPPEKPSMRIIPPESIIENKPPVKIKLKINQKTLVAYKNSTNTQVENKPEPTLKPVSGQSVNISQPTIEQTTEEIKPKVAVQPETRPTVETTTVESSLNDDETLFINSGTESSKKQIWMEYYNKAKTSRKKNIIVDKMKAGRFTITPDNKVLILPDYDVVNKDPDDILKSYDWL